MKSKKEKGKAKDKGRARTEQISGQCLSSSLTADCRWTLTDAFLLHLACLTLLVRPSLPARFVFLDDDDNEADRYSAGEFNGFPFGETDDDDELFKIHVFRRFWFKERANLSEPQI